MRAQSTGDGSRYELGLGVDVPPLPAGELASMRTRLQNADFDLPAELTEQEPAPAETEPVAKDGFPQSVLLHLPPLAALVLAPV